MGSYDLVVVGGGTGGLVSAMIAAGIGARVALSVEGRGLRFRRAMVATGSRPVVPRVPGLHDVEPLTTYGT